MSFKTFIFLTIIVLILLGLYYIIPKNSQEATNLPENIETNMKILSSAFEADQAIPSKYSCDGENINPALSLSDIPEGTESLALVMDDPDAVPVAGHVWIHWLVWNIDPGASEIGENSVPQGAVQGTTSSGDSGYGGPCPPPGDAHRYHFKLYALDSKLSIDSEADLVALEEAMGGHILDQAEIVGLYQRQ